MWFIIVLLLSYLHYRILRAHVFFFQKKVCFFEVLPINELNDSDMLRHICKTNSMVYI